MRGGWGVLEITRAVGLKDFLFTLGCWLLLYLVAGPSWIENRPSFNVTFFGKTNGVVDGLIKGGREQRSRLEEYNHCLALVYCRYVWDLLQVGAPKECHMDLLILDTHLGWLMERTELDSYYNK